MTIIYYQVSLPGKTKNVLEITSDLWYDTGNIYARKKCFTGQFNSNKTIVSTLCHSVFNKCNLSFTNVTPGKPHEASAFSAKVIVSQIYSLKSFFIFSLVPSFTNLKLSTLLVSSSSSMIWWTSSLTVILSSPRILETSLS